jgi:tRNA (adenine22-N1)-methyltransferase
VLTPSEAISARLQTIAAYIPDQMRVADIGGDHAWLLIHVARQQRLRQGIVGEVRRGPFANARERVALLGYGSLIEVRLGDGLSVLLPGEVDVIVLAGMGGSLICEILAAGKEKLCGIKRLILQPNQGGYRVRRWLLQNTFVIVAERLVEEAGILYEVIVAEPGEGSVNYAHLPLSLPQLFELGPVLWQKRDPLLLQKMLHEQRGRVKIGKQLEQAMSVEALQRKEEIKREIIAWEKVIACLSADMNSSK